MTSRSSPTRPNSLRLLLMTGTLLLFSLGLALALNSTPTLAAPPCGSP